MTAKEIWEIVRADTTLTTILTERELRVYARFQLQPSECSPNEVRDRELVRHVYEAAQRKLLAHNVAA